jgi:glutathione synthase/RimK-type ligase-like ATP-grasp enzyme
MQIAYVTYIEDAQDPDTDFDISIMVDALKKLGLNVDIVVWHDSNVEWSSFDAVWIRSTWDYAKKYSEFISWVTMVAGLSKLINPLDVILENSNKIYLNKLQSNGVPVIPSTFISSVSELQVSLEDEAKTFVMKPVIGAGARGARRCRGLEDLQSAVDQHFRNSEVDLIIQPYLDEVDTLGEIAVICCLGEPVHAIRKVPALSEGGHGDFAANVDIDIELSNFVKTILKQHVGRSTYENLLYSRVDVVPYKGSFLLMEIEAVEPALFLSMNPSSAQYFARKFKELLDSSN